MTDATTDRQLVGIVVALAAAFFLLPVVGMGLWMTGAGPMMGGPAHHGAWGTGDGPRGWMLALGAVTQLLALAVVVGGGYLVYRTLVGDGESTDPARQELRTAYARGELSDEEFERRRDRLRRDE